MKCQPVLARTLAPPTKLAALGLHSLRETFRADDGAFVQAARNDFVLVTGFDLERDLAVCDGDHLRAAMNRLADGRRCEVCGFFYKYALLALRMAFRRLTSIETHLRRCIPKADFGSA
jgi:hypothetical protein